MKTHSDGDGENPHSDKCDYKEEHYCCKCLEYTQRVFVKQWSLARPALFCSVHQLALNVKEEWRGSIRPVSLNKKTFPVENNLQK